MEPSLRALSEGKFVDFRPTYRRQIVLADDAGHPRCE